MRSLSRQASDVRDIADRFMLAGAVVEVASYGAGLINDTYIVTTDAGERAILQRLNSHVFPDPEGIQSNLRRLLRHRAALRRSRHTRLCIPEIVPTRDAEDLYVGDGESWRMSRFVGDSTSLQVITDLNQAYEVGAALGCFHAAFRDLDVEAMHDPLPGFHCTPLYLDQFDQVVASRAPALTPGSTLDRAFGFVDVRRGMASILEDGRRSGRLSPRVIHGDPKVDNVLFDVRTGRALGLIDLDTVKPGLMLYDIGDCVRSSCNVSGEEGHGHGEAMFDLGRMQSVLAGYFSEAREIVSGQDWDYVYAAIRLIPFELGLRFLSDHLAGNVYFKVQTPDQNLRRAMMQFELVHCIERQEAEINAICAELRQG